METKQPSANQNLKETKVQAQQVDSNISLFVAIIISVLLTAMVVGSIVCFWQKSINEKEIAVLKQKVSSLEEQISSMKKMEVSPESTLPKSDSSVNWETYTNQKLGFSVNYPKDWQIKEFYRDFAIIGKSKGVAIKPIDPEIVNENWGLITIEVEDNPDNLTIDSFINNYLCDSPGVCASAEKAMPITVSGVQGKKVVNPPGPVPSQVVVLINKDQIFTITVTLDKSLEELYSIQQKKMIFNQILSSFKFTN